MYVITLFLSYIILSHIYFYKIWMNLLRIYKKLENDYDNEQRMGKLVIEILKFTLEERKKCELCCKDYI